MSVSRIVNEPIVLLDGAPEPRLKVQSVHRSIGGQRLDSAVIAVNLWEYGDILNDMALKDEITDRQVEIVVDTQDGLTLVVHWGKVKQLRPVIDDRRIEFAFVSRVENYHFGEPIRGMNVLEKVAGQTGVNTIDEDLVFNPTVDGRVVPNMSSRLDPSGYRYFVDWGSSRTSAAMGWRGESSSEPELWTLAEAAMSLMYVGNADQLFVRNWDQSTDDLDFLFDGTIVKDHRIPRNLYLPQALDRLLEPYGYYWYLEYTGIGTRKIRFAKRGDLGALTAFVGLQKAGEAVDLTQTNCEAMDLQYDVGRNMANIIRVEGDYRHVEATFELQRAWKEDHDLLEESDLDRDSDEYLTNPEYQRVWRDWVLNEAGDYNGLRAEIATPYDFSELFDATDICARRRRFLPTLTRRKNQDGIGDDTPAGEVQGGVRVEWSNDGGTNWYDTSEREIQVLAKECGIRFNGQMPPAFLMHAATNAKVRVTATVRSDKRLFYSAIEPFSVNTDAVEVVIDKRDGFHLREVHTGSSYAEAVLAGDLTADTVDDSEAIQQYANGLLNVWNRAECGGSITLPGVDWSGYELGNAIAGVIGRNINFQTHHSEQRFPQIVAIDYDVRGQAMTLHLDALRENMDPPTDRRFGRGRRR